MNGEIAGCSKNSDAFKIAQWARRYDVTQFEWMFCKKVLKHNTQCFQTLFQYSAYKSHSTIAKLRFSDKQVYIKKRCKHLLQQTLLLINLMKFILIKNMICHEKCSLIFHLMGQILLKQYGSHGVLPLEDEGTVLSGLLGPQISIYLWMA